MELKILCVDHDMQTAEQIIRELDRQSYTVHSANGTLAAIEELEKHLDFDLMICEYRLAPNTVAPVFWHLSVHNYSLSTIIYCNEDEAAVKAQINFPDLITVIRKPALTKLCDSIQNYAKFLRQTTRTPEST